jgi:hypothetical protein
MKIMSMLLLVALAAGVSSAADRRWQTGTLTDVGIKRTATVGDPVRERLPPVFNRPVLTEVATYVIETADLRLELQDMVPITQATFDVSVKVGSAVTFAVEKKTAYIRKADSSEYRLLVLESARKKKP